MFELHNYSGKFICIWSGGHSTMNVNYKIMVKTLHYLQKKY